MLRVFNTLGKKLTPFRIAGHPRIQVFTCGPSVYQRSHIGNFRTFLFEDILIRYLEYSGASIKRGMNLTDIEDKAIEEAKKRKRTVKDLTEENITNFLREMKLLKMKIPDYLPLASEAVDEAVEIIGQLLGRKVAYWYKGNIYFDPLRYSRFGELYGLDMKRWPRERRRFHKDTYPGMRWNLGDFILWHGHKEANPCWDTSIGRGRPSWNIQDASMILKHYHKTLSVYCGGLDNLFRHHDYTRAIVESVRPYPMAKFWLHCHHLIVKGQKMSKSKGNIYHVEDLLGDGYTADEIRFFLCYGHYRKELNYTKERMRSAAERLRGFKGKAKAIAQKADRKAKADRDLTKRVKETFAREMDDDLNVESAFDHLFQFVERIDLKTLNSETASGLTNGLREVDRVLKILY
ncbi:MAG TPA: class I tRNA ligase family protein [Thermodesulfobacteriota bacterium]|nr:class I tRNA ligase family protein [Thermodesulfobacteriota bacterium]